MNYFKTARHTKCNSQVLTAYSLGNQETHTAPPMLTGDDCLYFSVLS